MKSLRYHSPLAASRWLVISAIWASLVVQMASAYISSAPHGGWDPNQHKRKRTPSTSISPDEASSSSSSSFTQPPTNVQVEDIFREEYRDWAKRYGKKADEAEGAERFDNFKLNFMLQMQHNKKTGIFYLLNEYGDMTVANYNQLMNKGRGNNISTSNDYNKKTDSEKSWTPSKDGKNDLSGVEIAEALAKTAQEYQNYLSRKSASANRRRKRENQNPPATPSPSNPGPNSPSGGNGEAVDFGESVAFEQSLTGDLEEQHRRFLDGITAPQDVVPTFKQEDYKPKVTKPKKESFGYAVTAELIMDPPTPQTSDAGKAPQQEQSTAPRVKPPPTVQAMGTSQSFGEKESSRQRPGTLENKFYRTVKGTPSNKSFFSGIGTQFIGISSNKRLIRWEPGMDE